MNRLTESDLDVLADWWEADDSDPSRTLVAAVEAIVAARLASVEALDGHAIAAAIYSGGGAVHPDASDRVLALLRAVLGSDAHTEQKGTGE